jgi:hypothetical protein
VRVSAISSSALRKVSQGSSFEDRGFDVWGPLDFDVTTIYDRVEDPLPDSSGDTPKKDDLRLVVGLSVDL